LRVGSARSSGAHETLAARQEVPDHRDRDQEVQDTDDLRQPDDEVLGMAQVVRQPVPLERQDDLAVEVKERLDRRVREEQPVADPAARQEQAQPLRQVFQD